ncbi:dipeptidylpeptidase, partial [Dipsacomyces acuminosporus]
MVDSMLKKQRQQQGWGELSDFQKYPRPGAANAAVDWVIVEIEHSASKGIVRKRVRRLLPQFCLRRLFPWHEYVVRAGWLPESPLDKDRCQCVWLQLLDRAQQRTAIVRIPLSCFDKGTSEAVDPLDKARNLGMDDQTANQRGRTGGVYVDILYEERQPNAWINLNNSLRFLKEDRGRSLTGSGDPD